MSVRRSIWSRAGAWVRFAGNFAREFLFSCAQILRDILLRPTRDLCPAFIVYEAGPLGPWEALLLSHAITLTPGTTVVEVEPATGRFLLHVLDGRDPAAVRGGIDCNFREPLLAGTR